MIATNAIPASGDLLGTIGAPVPHMDHSMYVPNDKMVMLYNVGNHAFKGTRHGVEGPGLHSVSASCQPPDQTVLSRLQRNLSSSRRLE